MARIEHNGAELWYDVTGDGPPLVVTGGFGLLHDQYEKITPLLNEHFTVINWNYRGAGKSDRSWPGGVYNLDVWVDDLEAIVKHLGHEKVSLWGTSTGSFITVRYGARYAARVEKLITFPLFKANAGFRAAFNAFRDIGENFGYEALAKLTQWIGAGEQNVFGGMGNELALWEAESFKRNFGMDTLGDTLRIFGTSDLSGDVARLKMPTMLLMGDSGALGASTPGTSELADAFCALAPQTKIAKVADYGGTYCMIEAPEATLPPLMDFLKG